mgnify:FL=1
MASLSGNKIKDTFNLLLKLANSNVGSSEQVVQDGAGNNSALKISTDTVETTGALKISGTPSTSTSVTSALMLSSSGVVVTRNLSTSPIGTASITANSPLSATGSTIELVDAGTLSQVTQPANNDKVLLWDESASAYTYIDKSDLATSINSTSSAAATPTVMWARQSVTIQQSSTGTVPVGTWAEIYQDTSATGATTATGSSVYFGTVVNVAAQPALSLASVSDPRDSILINEVAGWYRIQAVILTMQTTAVDYTLRVTNSSGTTNLVTINLPAQGGKILEQTLDALYYSDGTGGENIQLAGQAAGLGTQVYGVNTSMQVEYLGANTIL